VLKPGVPIRMRVEVSTRNRGAALAGGNSIFSGADTAEECMACAGLVPGWTRRGGESGVGRPGIPGLYGRSVNNVAPSFRLPWNPADYPRGIARQNRARRNVLVTTLPAPTMARSPNG